MKPYWKVTLWYLLFGFFWIFLSDNAIASFAANIQLLTFLQTLKGEFFVLLSGLLIFHLTKRSFNEAIAKDSEKLSVFRKTLESVYHILLNYLNAMQLVTMEAEKCRDFDPEILRVAKDISETALLELRKLEQIETISTDHIDAVVYQGLKNHPH